ncbi:hypothetical protein P9J83_17300 [Clostridium sporogenes]|uniref:Uncharacterized protein n=1 Tax=Clostridium sporogenes TaxID=1509 RepID=A0AAE4FNU2_CLOSG|nr:hypothetical protein [Clostridium sporogenes]MDS1005223.1 hypothetical protein [Clostridium sporogenes]
MKSKILSVVCNVTTVLIFIILLKITNWGIIKSAIISFSSSIIIFMLFSIIFSHKNN